MAELKDPIYENIITKVREYKEKVDDDNKIQEFRTYDINNLNMEKLNYLNKERNKEDSVLKLNKHLLDLDKSFQIEEGIFEYTILYSRENQLSLSLMMSVYNDKLNDIIENLNEESVVNNTYLKDAITNNKLQARFIAFLSPQDINPNRWEEQIRKANLRKYKKENMALSDRYPCKKCGERKAFVWQAQLRSIDEPMTTFIRCFKCDNTIKF